MHDRVATGGVYHVGLLVPDLDAAIERFRELLSIEFDAPKQVQVPHIVLADGSLASANLRLAVSVQGPPFLEVIEAEADGVWGRQQGDGLHHIGCWQSDLPARLRELERDGRRAEATIYSAGEAVAAYLDPSLAGGTRIELVAQRRKRAGD